MGKNIRYYYSYSEFIEDVKSLKLNLKDKEFYPDAILAIARGGLTLGHFIAIGLNIRSLYSINSIHYDGDRKLDYIEIFNTPDIKEAKRVLVVDDIVDSGETMSEVLRILRKDYPEVEFKVATLFYKKEALVKPDFSIKEAKVWIDFFWEADI